MNECTNEPEVCAVCAFSPGGCVIDQTLCTSVGLGMTVPDPHPEPRLLSSCPPRPISCHSFVAMSTHIKRFPLSFLPSLGPSRGEPVLLEVDADKSTKGSNFPPRKWQLVCLLTPFPKSGLSMFRGRKHRLGGCAPGKTVVLHSPQCYRNKGSSVRLDKMPVPPAIREA